MRVLPCVMFASLIAVAVAGAAHADGKYHPVPGGKAHLQLRVVTYDGEVNGALTVEVKNPSRRAASFTASGLYFVPDGDPDRAPQRLGAVGPMVIGERQADAVEVPAGGTVRVTLAVFCVDDHRDAPTSSTPFTLARHRMPATLARSIDREAVRAAKDAGGLGQPSAVEPVQAEVWKARDKAWVKLDGEGAQEAHKADHRDDDRGRERDGRIEERVPDRDPFQP